MTSTAGEERDASRGDPDWPLPADELFDVLRNGRRRMVVEALAEREGPMSVRELSEHVAHRELACEQAELSYRDRKGIHVALYQTHLPKLDDRDVIDYDTEKREVRATARLDALASYLEFSPSTSACPRSCVVRAAIAGVLVVAVLAVVVL